METIIVHPATPEETSFLEDLLNRMKFKFEKKSKAKVIISEDELKSINKGINEANENKLINSSDVHKKGRALCSK